MQVLQNEGIYPSCAPFPFRLCDIVIADCNSISVDVRTLHTNYVYAV